VGKRSVLRTMQGLAMASHNNKWSAQQLTVGVSMHAGNTTNTKTVCASHAQHVRLIAQLEAQTKTPPQHDPHRHG
jgi:hypothetical protein